MCEIEFYNQLDIMRSKYTDKSHNRAFYFFGISTFLQLFYTKQNGNFC